MDFVVQQLKKLRPGCSSRDCLLQEVIKRQAELVEALLDKVDGLQLQLQCAIRDKNAVVSENCELRRKLERKELSQSIEFRQFYAQNQSGNFQPLFEARDQKHSKLEQFVALNSPQNHATELDLIDYITGQKDKSSAKSAQGRTPILHEPIYRDRHFTSKYTLKGLVRSFYLKLLENPMSILKLIEIIETEYIHNPVLEMQLLQRYPDNQFIGSFIVDFLHKVSHLHSHSELIAKLNKYQLYDDILTQIFVNLLLNFAEIPTVLNGQSTKRCFFGLANSFQLELQVHNDEFWFYQSTVGRRESLEQSQYQHQVCEEISLNPKHVRQSISLIQKEKREPRFIIKVNEQEYYFQFCIREQNLVEQVQGQLIFSRSQNKPKNTQKLACEAGQFRANTEDVVLISKSQSKFNCCVNSGQNAFLSNQEQQSCELKEFDSQYDFKAQIVKSSNKHFVQISSILSESVLRVQEDNSPDSPQIIRQAKQRYQKLKMGSCESMLLSEYNRNSVYASKEMENEFRLLDKENRCEDNRSSDRSGRKEANFSANKRNCLRVRKEIRELRQLRE